MQSHNTYYMNFEWHPSSQAPPLHPHPLPTPHFPLPTFWFWESHCCFLILSDPAPIPPSSPFPFCGLIVRDYFCCFCFLILSAPHPYPPPPHPFLPPFQHSDFERSSLLILKFWVTPLYWKIHFLNRFFSDICEPRLINRFILPDTG